MDKKKMTDKCVLVTGSGTGIGREITLEFARQGADVVFHYGRSAEGALSAVKEAQGMGAKASAFKADFNEVDQVKKLAKDATEFLGGIDILINNAGITFNKPLLEVTQEQFDTMLHVNIRAQFFLNQQVVKEMLKKGKGAICNITSIHGLAGAPEHSVYAATKGAIIAYTRSLAMELAYQGIRVNAIAPGWVNVENYAKIVDNYDAQASNEYASKVIPIARAGVPKDIAKLAVFLCSDDAEYIVGQTIVADGGTTALLSLAADFRASNPSSFGKGYLPGV